jgi:hypothetical protein
MRKILLICAMCFVAMSGMADERVVAKVTTKGWVLANQLVEVLEKLKGNAPKPDEIILPGNVDKAGNKKIIL